MKRRRLHNSLHQFGFRNKSKFRNLENLEINQNDTQFDVR